MSEAQLALVPARQPDNPVDSWVAVIRPVITLSEHVAETEFVPRAMRGNPAAIAAAILHGRELGLPPMTALAQTHVIDGKPTLSAEAMRGLVLAAGHDLEFLETTDATVTIRGRRAGGERWTAVTWTLDRARHAGLLGKPRSAWATYPRAMLAARATAELCRLVFPDVLHGMAATEELLEPETTEQPTGSPTRPVKRRAAEPVPVPTPPPDQAFLAPAAAPAEIPLPPPPAAPAGDDTDTAPPETVTPAQLRMLGALWGKFGVTDEERRALTERYIGRDIGGTTKNLGKHEASRVIDLLAGLLQGESPDTLPPDEARELLLNQLDRGES